ncbi:heavy-metal-associated domain-containing protein [Burkholderia pseudomultivorans]|uniref:heavy-metal-associated domain-containing protein n=1 Tax=Burkholderia pseudomultivorans TaxID=1207504 RepID=UPI00188F440D|nr:heavy-metal-associated domain-containing protein [Burkholderia pseudomultivorans]
MTRLEGALQATPGVVSAQANLSSGAADVEYLPEKASFSGIRQAIESSGYHVAEPKSPKSATEAAASPEEPVRHDEYHALMRKFCARRGDCDSLHGPELSGADPASARLDTCGQRHPADRLGPAWRPQSAGHVLVRVPVPCWDVGCAQAPLSQHSHMLVAIIKYLQIISDLHARHALLTE